MKKKQLIIFCESVKIYCKKSWILRIPVAISEDKKNHVFYKITVTYICNKYLFVYKKLSIVGLWCPSCNL